MQPSGETLCLPLWRQLKGLIYFSPLSGRGSETRRDRSQQSHRDHNCSSGIKSAETSVPSAEPGPPCARSCPAPSVLSRRLVCSDVLSNDLSSLFSGAALGNPITSPTPRFCAPRALNPRTRGPAPPRLSLTQGPRFPVTRPWAL